MDAEDGAGDGLRPGQREILQGLFKRFFDEGERNLLVEAPTGVGKTRIALEFVREVWKRRGRCRVLVVVPRRVLAYNPWKKEVDKWLADLRPECLILTGFMTPEERALAHETFSGDILIMTCIALNNDVSMCQIDLGSFGVIIFDEAHRVVAHSEEYGQYRYSVYYRQMVLQLLASKEAAVLGLTIPETERTRETEVHLDAVGVTSDATPAPRTETYVMRVSSAHAVKADLWFRNQIRRSLHGLKKVLGNKVPWMIGEDRLLEILEDKEVPRWSHKWYVAALRRYKALYQARQDTWEGNGGRALKKIGQMLDENELKNVGEFIRGAAYDKLFHVAWLVKRLAASGKRVMVYTKFRQSALRLQRLLWDEYDMLVETFMGGDPPSKLADLKEGAQVVIFTPVAREGLDLPEFDCIVHVSAHADEFTRRQIRGRIRGGKEYYVVFADTNDEWKLQTSTPEPEGPLRSVEVEQARLPITKVDRSTYKVSFEQASKAPYVTLPVTALKQLREGPSAVALGRLGEAVVTHHYELSGRRVYKLSYSLIRRSRIGGLSREQLECVKRLCYGLPNPPMDLVAVGNPTLLVEVKTTTKTGKAVVENRGSHALYFEKARALNLIPTLAVVRVTMEKGWAILSIDRYAFS